jgi:hypothetical protein
MLTEDDVVAAVCAYLQSEGWTIVRSAATTQRGDDIVAKRGAEPQVFVEAKGETSNRAGSTRHGKPFDSSQCRDHVANAFYSAAAFIGLGQPAIALPDTRRHRAYVAKIGTAMDALGIWVFWVAADSTVSCTGKASHPPGSTGQQVASSAGAAR